MTTPTYPSVTDELLAEIEAAAKDSKLNIYRPFGWDHSVRCGNHMQTDFEFLSLVSPETVLALTDELSRLRAENEELKAALQDIAEYEENDTVELRRMARYAMEQTK